MKSSDYIVSFFAGKGIDHFFGYQGTMIAHFVDSVYQSKDVENHVCYNEQGAAFAAVGYAKAKGRCGLAYATSGPGALNLVSGIADAYYDSTPVIFITGQLNTYEYTGIEGIRQNGFQETDVVSIVKSITKYTVKVEKAEDIRYVLEKAWYEANTGRRGPVVIDLPMDMQRQDIDPDSMKGFLPDTECIFDDPQKAAEEISDALNESRRPVILLGNGIIKDSDTHYKIKKIAEKADIPIVTSMLGRHLMSENDRLNFGYLGGGYGHRYANMIVYKKADLIISLGCSMCKRQTAMNTEKFAEDALIMRVEIDPHELKRVLHQDERDFFTDCRSVIDELVKKTCVKRFEDWLETCSKIKSMLKSFDDSCEERKPNKYIEAISDFAEDSMPICCDVGQHQVWGTQSFKLKPAQRLLISGGHGAMGFSLPAAIGAYYALGKRAFVIAGDGAIQMNIQELQWVVREQIPVTIFVMNNNSLGLIHQQQDDIFESRYAGSTDEGGYTTPDFTDVAQAYGISAKKAESIPELISVLEKTDMNKPALIEIILETDSKASPKTYFGEEMYNQRPYMPDDLMKEILDM